MKSFLINAGDGCRVWFCDVSDISEFIKSGRAAIITNSHVNDLYGSKISEALSSAGVEHDTYEVPIGEDAKTLESLTNLYDWLLEKNFERGDHLIALGGGSVGDIAGFAAATYKRGMNFAYIPTTLLSQADSCIGGKFSINYKIKNMIGLFNQPQFVLIDTNLLQSLNEKEISLGLVEIVKHAIIEDEEMFSHIEKNSVSMKKLEGIDKMVWKSCKIKASIVEKDLRDRGARMLLNYGHTIGQSIEAASNFVISHGEAVSVGMCYESQLAQSMGIISKEDVERQRSLLSSLGMKTSVDGTLLKEALKYIRNDKKAKGGELRFAFPAAIGRGVIKTVSVEQVESFLEQFIESE